MARYITTTLPYVNAKPHLGYALEAIEADAYARSLRERGEEVFFNIGTDEHGAKILQKAEESGKTPQAYTDEYAERYTSFAKRLGISYDTFTRTTDAHHVSSAQAFWQKCADAGDIYKAQYEVKYCVGCELEKTDSELVNGKCPLHPNQDIEIRTEENYYFRFSKYQDALLAHYAQNPDFIIPHGRMSEITSFVAGGLKDFSISRPREKLSWGVPVPGDDAHTMYVWFDALVNYISAIGWPDNEATFSKWWPVTQFAGKDNLRQQTAMWQAMLMSAGIPLSRQVFIHGFLLSDGQKMSKSFGNVIDPLAIADKYGVDALRYILLRHANPFEDSDITEASIEEQYTANLVNGLGNLVARIMKLAETHLQAPITAPPSTSSDEIADMVNAFQFNSAMDFIWGAIQNLDIRLTSEESFKVVKTDPEKGKQMIAEYVLGLYKVAESLTPFMPETSAKILDAVRVNKKPENLFPRHE